MSCKCTSYIPGVYVPLLHHTHGNDLHVHVHVYCTVLYCMCPIGQDTNLSYNTDLSLGIHEGHCVRPITYDELLTDFGQDVNTVDSHVVMP